ncbi:MAG: dihydropteroate synthase [Clostridia bacterium]
MIKIYVVGATINTSVSGINELLNERDEKKLLELVEMQLERGANTLAINCGSRETEVEDIIWMFKTIQDNFKIPLCIDSPDPLAHEAALKIHRHGRALLDSTTLEKTRISAIVPLAKKYDTQLVVLLHDENGMPSDVAGRIAMMEKVEAMVAEYNFKRSDIYLDCLVFPLSVDKLNAKYYLDSISAIKIAYPGYKYICGLNNISFGLPEMDILNCNFISMAAAIGQDSIFIELSKASAAMLRGLQALTGEDDNCRDYLKAYRNKSLDIFK